MAKTISDAINEAVMDDEDVQGAADDTTDETTSTEVAEDDSTGGTLLDEEDDDAVDSEDDTPDTTTRGDVVGEDDDETPKTETEESDIFDQITPEELAEIKASPTMNKLRKALMRGYNEKTSEHSQLVQLGTAYKQNPVGVLRAMADQLGMTLTQAQAQQAVAAADQKPAEADPGKELEDLFGETVGPKVRAVFDKWAEARFGAKLTSEVAPLRDAVGRITNQGEIVRMQGEEQQFKSRHKDLTPSMEKEIVELGKSGKIVPGTMTPQEYLDTLYDIVTARNIRKQQSTAARTASTKLAQRIATNQKDVEPTGQSGRGGKVQAASKVSNARNISQALDLAMAELEAEERR